MILTSNKCEKHLEFMEIDYTKIPPEFYCKKCKEEKEENKDVQKN
jgi:hypothetical protein